MILAVSEQGQVYFYTTVRILRILVASSNAVNTVFLKQWSFIFCPNLCEFNDIFVNSQKQNN